MYTCSNQLNSFKTNSYGSLQLSSKQIKYVKNKQRGQLVVTNAVREVFMPALSSTMTEGKVVTWLKGVGDKVSKGEPLVVIESDKADMDVEAFNDGILGAISVQEGESAGVGNAIAFIAESEAELEEAKKKAGAGGAVQQQAPQEVSQPPPQAEAPKPEPVMAATAPQQAQQPPPPSTPPPQAAPQKRADGRIIATPYAKEIAKKLGVDLSTVNGSGINGRITAGDVEIKAGKAPSTQQQPQKIPASVGAQNGAVHTEQKAPTPSTPPPQPSTPSVKGSSRPFNGLEKSVANNMLESKKVPEFRISMSITTDKFDKLYQELKPKGVTMTALIAKACAQALIKHDRIYAGLTPDKNGIVFHSSINIAVAVAMPDGGLITPVLKNADMTDIYQLSREWGDLVKRARGKKLKPDEYSTGNFSISNMGMYGVDNFDAMIQPGITSILAIGAANKTVVVNDDNSIAIKKIMQVTISCDHRIAYGVHAAEFLGTLKQVIENPDQLLK